MTKQAIGLWCKKPGAPIRTEGARVYVRWPEFARWREQELVAGAKKDAPAGSFIERRQAAEARSAEIKMELDEIALAEKRGEVVPVDDFGAAVGKILDRLTARLRGMSPKFAEFGQETETAVEKEAEQIVSELHRWDEDVIDEPEDEPPGGEGLAA